MNPFLNITSNDIFTTSGKIIDISVNTILTDAFGNVNVPLSSMPDINLNNLSDQKTFSLLFDLDVCNHLFLI